MVLLSEYVPVTVNCWFKPAATLAIPGVIMIPDNTGGVTVRLALALNPPLVAVMTVLPPAIPVANPVEVMVAIEVFNDVNVADDVRSCVVLSEYVPITVYC